jgi:acyl-coenzyme A synthetase/AMP-(fatty) acid ligase
MGIYDFTFYDLIQRNVTNYGKRPAWFEAEDQRTTTFAQIKEQVDRLASGLQKLGIQKGDRICWARTAWSFFCFTALPRHLALSWCPSTGGCRWKRRTLI